jgi:4-hydroxy-4-methyl-2-oxoglutarate aldolase
VKADLITAKAGNVDKSNRAYYDWIAAKLYTAVLADTMDKMGRRNQIMRPEIRPLYPEAKIVGRAATMLAVDTYQMPQKPYELEMELLDDLKPAEVVVCRWLGTRPAAVWGELLSTCAAARGARGAIIDGYCRDTCSIAAMKFPVFAVGLTPADSMGRCDVIAIRVPIEIGEARVNDGDLVVADYDGGVVIPQDIEDEVIRRAMEKVNGENLVRNELAHGASIQQVFKKYRIL